MQDTVETVLFWVPTALGATALVLMAVNMSLGSGNAARQAELANRAQFISETAQRSRNAPLLRDLVIAAQKPGNDAIRGMLTKYGIAYQAQPPAQPAKPAAAPAAAKPAQTPKP